MAQSSPATLASVAGNQSGRLILAQIIDFWERKEHFEGEAHCIICHHKWRAKGLLGSAWLECPKCHSMRGVLKGDIGPRLNEPQWQCGTCDNTFFILVPYAAFCIRCGQYIPWDDIC